MTKGPEATRVRAGASSHVRPSNDTAFSSERSAYSRFREAAASATSSSLAVARSLLLEARIVARCVVALIAYEVFARGFAR